MFINHEMVGASDQYTQQLTIVKRYAFISSLQPPAILPLASSLPSTVRGWAWKICFAIAAALKKVDEYYQKTASSDAHIMAIGMLFMIQLLG